MKFLILLGLSLVLTNCNRRTCPTATEIDIFKKNLKIIKDAEQGHNTILVDDYRKAINFISLVTGIDSKADYSSTIGYRKKSEYKSDLKKWKKWYRENQCKLTGYYVDSVYKRVGLKR